MANELFRTLENIAQQVFAPKLFFRSKNGNVSIFGNAPSFVFEDAQRDIEDLKYLQLCQENEDMN